MKKNTVKINENSLKQIVAESVKKVLHESIKGTDPNNVVSKEIAEKFGFKPEYTGFDNGLELWGKRLNFNPLEDYAQANKLLRQLGIRRFTSEDYKGHVRITVGVNAINQKDKRPYPSEYEIQYADINQIAADCCKGPAVTKENWRYIYEIAKNAAVKALKRAGIELSY